MVYGGSMWVNIVDSGGPEYWQSERTAVARFVRVQHPSKISRISPHRNKLISFSFAYCYVNTSVCSLKWLTGRYNEVSVYLQLCWSWWWWSHYSSCSYWRDAAIKNRTCHVTSTTSGTPWDKASLSADVRTLLRVGQRPSQWKTTWSV